ncbi:unnamed protein product [Blepharisma stoltei]|uniref:Translin-associated factor X-interacting protein 1 N-terminal domain-containing protein n=1 Tax=Blepharisma stoltei TaxID=1481888 RepID=A0AAU9K4A6_9CILI|nr:unnamed protein product [Blepharisma stoltei]
MSIRRKLTKSSDFDFPQASGSVTPVKNPSFSQNFSIAAGKKQASLTKLPTMKNLQKKLSLKVLAPKPKAFFNDNSESDQNSWFKEFSLIDDKVRNFCSSESSKLVNNKIRFQIDILEEMIKLPSGISDFLKFIQLTLRDILTELESNKWRKKYEDKSKKVTALISEKMILNEKIEHLLSQNAELKNRLDELRLKNIKTIEAFGKCKESSQYKLYKDVNEKNQLIKEIKCDINLYRSRETKIIMMLQELRARGYGIENIIKRYNIFGEECPITVNHSINDSNISYSSATMDYFQESPI